ncbi:MAG: hypothetical protein ACRCS6_12990 [Turicibacter sp.]
MRKNNQKRFGIILASLGVVLSLLAMFIFKSQSAVIISSLGGIAIIIGSYYMLKNTGNTVNSKIAKEMKLLEKDERLVQIREKTAHSVSQIMNYILLALLWTTAVFMKNMTCLFIISILITIKFTLTLIYTLHYNKTV